MKQIVLSALLVLAALGLGGPSALAASPPATRASVATALVNINTASVEELTALPGIGPALATRIVEHRRQKGPFATVEDLLAVRGVGPKMLAKIRDRLTVGPPQDRS